MLADRSSLLVTTYATDLAAGIADFNIDNDIYLGELGSPDFRLVSSALGRPTLAAGASWSQPLATPTGSTVAFDSRATDFSSAADPYGLFDVMRWRDTSEGGGQLISHTYAEPGGAADGESRLLGLSADGETLLFESEAGDLTQNFVDRNGSPPDLFLHLSGRNVLVTRNQAGDGFPLGAQLAKDGSVVVFTDRGSQLVPGAQDGNGVGDLFVFETVSGALSLAVHALENPAATPDRGSQLKEISADGRFVLFDSGSSNLLPGPMVPDGATSCYLLDRRLDQVFLISYPAAGPTVKTTGEGLALSADGRYVIFASPAPDLVPGQVAFTESVPPWNLFLHDRATGERLLLTHAPGERLRPGSRGYPQQAVIAEDGQSVAFTTSQNGLAADDPGEYDLFLGRLERGGLLFGDGFEMGDSSLWSATFGGN